MPVRVATSAAVFWCVLLFTSSVRCGEPAPAEKPVRVGIIGIDAHAVWFTEAVADPKAKAPLNDMKIVAAVPTYNPDVAYSRKVFEPNKKALERLGVEMCDKIETMLPKVDAVMILSIDGRQHTAEVAPVFAARKPVFIDKPVAGSLVDVVRIYQQAEASKTPCFTNSSLRYSSGIAAMKNHPKVGKVLGCDVYGANSPLEPVPGVTLNPPLPDLFYYGIHGCEELFTIMGPGCKTVSRVKTPTADFAVGLWADGRVGTFRGILQGPTNFGATVFGERGIAPAGPFEGYVPLLVEIAKFFRTGKPPVTVEQTLEIYAFMEAADESKRQGGAPISLESVLAKARQAAAQPAASR